MNEYEPRSDNFATGLNCSNSIIASTIQHATASFISPTVYSMGHSRRGLSDHNIGKAVCSGIVIGHNDFQQTGHRHRRGLSDHNIGEAVDNGIVIVHNDFQKTDQSPATVITMMWEALNTVSICGTTLLITDSHSSLLKLYTHRATVRYGRALFPKITVTFHRISPSENGYFDVNGLHHGLLPSRTTLTN
ncbi:hypothetical protein TNCV_3488401 [Trichonephila clavipes]|nr:hypothetical protein TNCV_3488401 [Trichonephila clavipes]